MELLTDADLRELCKSLRIPLHYVGYKDTFTKISPQPGAYIVNLDSKTNNRGGTHWTALIIKKNKKVVYFDPFGLTIPIPIRTFIMRIKPKQILFSTRQIQQIDSTLCGYFCIYFLYFFTVLHTRYDDNIGYLINKHDSIYVQQNRRLNDGIIQKLIKTLFFSQSIL